MSEQNEIVKREARAQVQIEVRGLRPSNFEELWRMAEMVSSSTFAPSNMRGKPVECMVAMAHGLEVGLGPMQSLQNIAVINGRPSIWGDAMIGLVLGAGLMADQNLEYEGEPFKDNYAAVYACQRKGFGTPSVTRYSVADAKRAGLWGKKGPWTDYPDRMLSVRARAFGLRNTFADVLGGLYMAEEWGVTRESFDPDRMAAKRGSLDSASESIGGLLDNGIDADETEIIDAEPDAEPDAPAPEPTDEPPARSDDGFATDMVEYIDEQARKKGAK